MVQRQRAMKKVMHIVFFRSMWLVKTIKFEGQITITANRYTTIFIPEILQEVNVRGLVLHHNNAFSHSGRLTIEFLKQKQIKVEEQLSRSLDLAICDFGYFLN